MITENDALSGKELDRPEYERIVDANGNIGNNVRGSRDYVNILFGIEGDKAEILLLSHNNKPIDHPNQSPDKVEIEVTNFIKENYDVKYVRFSE